MAHVAESKKQVVNDFNQLVADYPIIGALNMQGLPARQLQLMRERLRDTCVIRMTKRRLMNVIFEQSEQSKKGISQLAPHLKGMPALLFTKENPFTLYKTLKKNKSPAPAKGGQVAPKDIKIPAGPTPFAPGPIIGELGKFGLKTGVEGGKVAIKEDKVVCKEGEEISAELAGLLTRLQIFPMEVGLDLSAVYEDGMIYEKQLLDVDEEQYVSDLVAAAQGAFNLAMNATVLNEVTTPALLTKAAGEARNLALGEWILIKDLAPEQLGLAQANAVALASHLPEELIPDEARGAAVPTQAAPDQPPEEKKEPQKEEKQEADAQADAAAGMGALFG